jgi:hypothetical protein
MRLLFLNSNKIRNFSFQSSLLKVGDILYRINKNREGTFEEKLMIETIDKTKFHSHLLRRVFGLNLDTNTLSFKIGYTHTNDKFLNKKYYYRNPKYI